VPFESARLGSSGVKLFAN